jgi:hypothetical protein
MNEPEKRGGARDAVVTRHHHRRAALSDTLTTEYKYGEFAEITGKLGGKINWLGIKEMRWIELRRGLDFANKRRKAFS